jgi:hypothetical protein
VLEVSFLGTSAKRRTMEDEDITQEVFEQFLGR